MPTHPFRNDNGWPILRDSWVLYLDALGTKEAAERITNEDLFDLVQAEAWYRRFIHHQNMERVQESLYFTDDVVVARPDDVSLEDSVRGFSDLLWGAAVYSIGMAIDVGHLVRGGFSRGAACLDPSPQGKDAVARFNVAHGDGLIRAIKIEQDRAKVPRVVVGDRALARIEECHTQETSEFWWIPRPCLLRDTSDGEVFVDHLGYVMQDTEPNLNVRDRNGDPLTKDAILARFRSFIVAGLDHYLAGSKYRWLAEYFDYTVSAYGAGSPIGAGGKPHFEPWLLSLDPGAQA